MNKAYKDILVDTEKEYFKYFSEFGHKVAGVIDKSIVWIIGLSTGAITLFVINSEKFTTVDKCLIKWAIGILIISIVLGLLGRVLYNIAFYIGYSFVANFSLEVNKIAEPKTVRKLGDNETSEFIYLLMLEDFNVDMPIILENKKNTTDHKKHIEDIAARKLYNDYALLVTSKVNETNRLITNLKNAAFMKDGNEKGSQYFFYHKFQQFNKFVGNRKGIIHRDFTYLSFSLYVLSAIFFVFAVLFVFLVLISIV